MKNNQLLPLLKLTVYLLACNSVAAHYYHAILDVKFSLLEVLFHIWPFP
jgi:hypothetical protein